VVPADAGRPEGGEALDDAVGLGTVAHDVTEMPDRIDRSDRIEDRVEGDEIRMNIRQDGDAH